MIPFRFEKVASVENDTGRPDSAYSGADAGFNTSKEEGYGGQPFSPGGPPGAAYVPGMSIHCLSCGKKCKEGQGKCQCGADVSRVVKAPQSPATNQGPTKDAESGDISSDTGGEATVDQDRTRGAYVGLGKYAGVSDVLKPLMGGAAVAGSGAFALKAAPVMSAVHKEQRKQETMELVQQGRLPESELLKFQHFQELEKFARSGANPILRLRQALDKARKASGKFRVSMVHRSK